MSFSQISDESCLFNENREPEQPISFSKFNYNNDSYSCIFQNSPEYLNNDNDNIPESSLINSNLKILVDKECSPAPAPTPGSLENIQNKDLAMSGSHNMECPEVVNKKKEDSNEGFLDQEMKNILNKINNEEQGDFIGVKPIGNFLFFDNNLLNFNENNDYYYETNNNENYDDLDNKGAAMNIINLNEQRELIAKNNNKSINGKKQKRKKNNQKKSNVTKNENSKKKKIFEENIKPILVRKFKADSVRKKIKSRLHKKLKNILNKKLKEYGSKMFFDLLPQPFIKNININFNKPLLTKTMREIFMTKFGTLPKDRDKLNWNEKVLHYLDLYPDIKNDPDISSILDNTYENVIKNYMEGNYLKEDLEMLKKEGENEEYIYRYEFIGKHWVEFYVNDGRII